MIPDNITAVIVEGEEVSGLYFLVEISHPIAVTALAACAPLPVKLRRPRLHLDQQCAGVILHFHASLESCSFYGHLTYT